MLFSCIDGRNTGAPRPAVSGCAAYCHTILSENRNVLVGIGGGERIYSNDNRRKDNYKKSDDTVEAAFF